MQTKLINACEFEKGIKSLLKNSTSLIGSAKTQVPSFIDSTTNKYIIPEKQISSIDDIAAESHAYFSELNNQNTHNRSPMITESGLYGEITEGLFMNPNFSWDCNPAAADLEIITGEIVRKQIGLDEKFSYGQQGMSKLCLNFNDAFTLFLQECRISRAHESDYLSDSQTVVYGIDTIDQKKVLNMFEISHSRSNVYLDNSGTALNFEKLQDCIEKDRALGNTILMYVYTPRNLETMSKELNTLIQFKNQYRFDIFVNLEAFDYLPMISSNFGAENLSKYVDFAYIDNSKLTGLSTNMLFISNRESLKDSLEIVEKEYYKSKDIPVNNLDEGSSEQLITRNKYTAHHYNIGFGHAVGVYRIFMTLQLLGEEGLHRINDEHNTEIKEVIAAINNAGIKYEYVSSKVLINQEDITMDKLNDILDGNLIYAHRKYFDGEAENAKGVFEISGIRKREGVLSKLIT